MSEVVVTNSWGLRLVRDDLDVGKYNATRRELFMVYAFFLSFVARRMAARDQ